MSRSRDGLLAAGTLVAATAAGALSATRPVLALALVCGGPVLVLLVGKSGARLGAVLLGALLVFESDANAPKLAYLALAGFCFALSMRRLLADPDPVLASFRPLILPSLAMGVMILASGLVAHGQGTLTSDWVHDVLPYVLLIALPIVGLDASRDLAPQAVPWLIAATGLLAAVGFALDWTNRRGVAGTGLGRIVLATATLAALGFCYAFVQAGHSRHWARWLLLATAIAGLLLVTGTRTNVVLVFGVIGAIGAVRKARIPLRRATGLSLVAGVATVALLPILASHLVSDPTFLGKRLADALSVLHGNTAGDQSLAIRDVSYRLARQQFEAHPWLGGGPGHIYPNDSFTLDTPWAVPAKFGIVGSVLLVSFFVALGVCTRRTRLLVGYLPIQTVARAWAFVLLALTPFGAWPEDKGTALAVTLLVAALATEVRAARDAEVDTPSGASTLADPGLSRVPGVRG